MEKRSRRQIMDDKREKDEEEDEKDLDRVKREGVEKEQKSDDEEEEGEEVKGAEEKGKRRRRRGKSGDRPSINLLLIQHSREVRRVLECAATFWRPSEKQPVRF